MHREQMKKYIMDAMEDIDQTSLEQLYWFVKLETCE